MERTPRQELDRRLDQLQAHLTAVGLDGALLHGLTNVYYYSGTAQQAHLWVPAQGNPRLLVRRVLERARRESALPLIEPLTSLKQLPGYLVSAKHIGMELDILPVTSFGHYQRILPGITIEDIGPFARTARSVKSEYEVEQIRTAARLADAAYEEMAAALRPGMTEVKFSAIAEFALRRHGFQGVVRWHATTGFECPWIHVLAGESALAFSFADTPFGGEGLTPAVPYGAGLRRIEPGMPVCLDWPMGHNGYINDQTRTLVIGTLDAELIRAHEVCREILAAIEREARPGVTGEELWERSLAIATQAGLSEYYMGWGDSRVTFVGHGVGLELDELPIFAPRQREPLVPGHVIAVEPKFFFPGKGAVGLENTYVIRADGTEKLTVTADTIRNV